MRDGEHRRSKPRQKPYEPFLSIQLLAVDMAIEYTIKAVCDKCGAEIEPQTPVKKGDIESTRWEWQRRWKKTGIMQGLPNRYGKYKLYCRTCAGS